MVWSQVDRHLRKLDQELAKFKMELEADNAGITEILERREWQLSITPPPTPEALCPQSITLPTTPIHIGLTGVPDSLWALCSE